MPTHETSARELHDGLFAFIDQAIMPIQREIEHLLHDPRRYWAEDGRVAPEILDARQRTRQASAAAGFYTMFCPTEFGGGGLGSRMYFDVWEELCYRYGSPQTQLPFVVLAHTSTGPSALWLHASDELKDEVIGPLSRGELAGSFAMSEPDAGSDAWMMTTKATRDGDEWVINGSKMWATYGPTADFVITFAVTDAERFAERKGGLTCFYVPADAPGYKVDSIVKCWDEPGGEECIITFDDVRIPDRYRVGPVGEGFRVAMQGSGQLKLTKTGRTIGLARWSVDRALEFARVRKTFGKTLDEHQSIQNMLADSCTEIYASKAMAWDIADKLDRGLDPHFERSMANTFVFEAMYRVYDRSMQILGGMSLANESNMIQGWHTLRVCRISEGPTEVQRRAVARHVLRSGPAFTGM
ncbi:MAG: acyl-CoA dehydrogenase family protein [Ilumatobacteraceae bacterium]